MIPASLQIAQQYIRDLASIAGGALADASGATALRPPPQLMPTPRDVIAREGTAALYRFVPPEGVVRRGRPLLLVPSLINQWYVLDLRRGASLIGALVASGVDVFCLDWGAPEDEDRHRTWDDVLGRLDRMVRRTLRTAGANQLGLLGYCMGGTLATIYTSLFPTRVAALIDLAGPIDFSQGGMLRTMVDRRWFDADAIADAGNVSPDQMQSGFSALRPTLELAKWVGMPELMRDPVAYDAYRALDAWASDNIAFPAAAYRTYIGELYQDNRLVAGTHRALGRAARLDAITCPTAVIVADKDTICPPTAATALLAHVATKDTTTLRVPGGHVGAVVGSRAARELYPAVASWLDARLRTA
jgi:polyhydroxyalkanoate synthase subunit PhaC